MDLSRPFKENRLALPLSTPLSSRRSMAWYPWLCARRYCLIICRITFSCMKMGSTPRICTPVSTDPLKKQGHIYLNVFIRCIFTWGPSWANTSSLRNIIHPQEIEMDPLKRRVAAYMAGGVIHTQSCPPPMECILIVHSRWPPELNNLNKNNNIKNNNKCLCVFRLTGNNNNNVHLSCAHQRPERSHDTY